jgi:predicted MFS family arabinose efflux permease
LAAFPLFLLLANATSPAMGFAVALPLCLVAPASLHPVLITLSKNAAGSTQALRMSLMMGGTFGVASVAVMAAGALIERGVASSSIFVFVALCCLAAAMLSAWQALAHRK